MNLSMSEGILRLAEFNALPVEQRAELLQTWRENFKNKDILSGMGIDANTLYKLIHQLGLPRRKREKWELPKPQATNMSELQRLRDEKVKAGFHIGSSSVLEQRPLNVFQTSSEAGASTHQESEETQSTRFVIELNGSYTGGAIAGKFAGLGKFLEGDNQKYRVVFKMEEIK